MTVNNSVINLCISCGNFIEFFYPIKLASKAYFEGVDKFVNNFVPDNLRKTVNKSVYDHVDNFVSDKDRIWQTFYFAIFKKDFYKRHSSGRGKQKNFFKTNFFNSISTSGNNLQFDSIKNLIGQIKFRF
jgi:hypothetical protein